MNYLNNQERVITQKIYVDKKITYIFVEFEMSIGIFLAIYN